MSLSGGGPLPRFAEWQVRKALEIIAERGRIGRKELARELGTGEGSVRTILERLERRGLITSSRRGHSITAKGRRELGKVSRYVRVDAGDLTVGDVDVATIVRGAAAMVKQGIEQRDEAIKAGADGATVLVLKDGKLQFPDGFFEVPHEVGELLIEIFKPKEGDVVIIGTGKDELRAEAGARAAARTLARSKGGPL
ncbi:MAG: winged helix-turn-helix transcriptional regulator [Hadesarchaea archaeon]|nr:winged helix-turn-helix transcriptional regulator [Hadesarchaea archaeon]